MSFHVRQFLDHAHVLLMYPEHVLLPLVQIAIWYCLHSINSLVTVVTLVSILGCTLQLLGSSIFFGVSCKIIYVLSMHLPIKDVNVL